MVQVSVASSDRIPLDLVEFMRGYRTSEINFLRHYGRICVLCAALRDAPLLERSIGTLEVIVQPLTAQE